MYQTILHAFAPILNYLYLNHPKLYTKFYFSCKYIFELDKVKFVREWLKKGDVCIDVGANIGFYTSVILGTNKRILKIYAFEPDRINYKLLKENITIKKNARLFRYAVGLKQTLINMYKSPIHNTNHHTYNIGESRDFEKVRCIKLDNFIPKRNSVNLLKIDVQGYDYFVLKGAEKIIRRSNRIAIVGEIWPYALNKLGIHPNKYVDLVKKFGFIFVNNKLNTIDLNMYINKPKFYIDFIAVKLKTSTK